MPSKVSILIACYNAECWVDQAIKSALNQTYRNKEIIVVNDGSTDRSLEIVKSFNSRIKWETGPNRGANVARNRLIVLSKGDWLQFLDADDYIKKDKIQLQINCAYANPKADIIYSPVLVEEGGIKKRVPMPAGDDIIANFLHWECLQTGGFLIKRNAIEDVGGWKEDQKCCQEHELLSRFVKYGKHFTLDDNYQTVYRIWSYFTVSRTNIELVVRSKIAILDDLRSFMLSKNEWKKDYEDIYSRIKFECARLVYANNTVLATETIKEVKKKNKSFYPTGPAAPFLYKVLYWFFGFETSEKIAAFLRKFRKNNKKV